MGIDGESQLFIILPLSLFTKIECSVYSRRKRKLFFAQDDILKLLVNPFQ